mgnify:CR=1 FL=1
MSETKEMLEATVKGLQDKIGSLNMDLKSKQQELEDSKDDFNGRLLESSINASTLFFKKVVLPVPGGPITIFLFISKVPLL